MSLSDQAWAFKRIEELENALMTRVECSTCGMRLNDPMVKFCSNPIHLDFPPPNPDKT